MTGKGTPAKKSYDYQKSKVWCKCPSCVEECGARGKSVTRYAQKAHIAAHPGGKRKNAKNITAIRFQDSQKFKQLLPEDSRAHRLSTDANHRTDSGASEVEPDLDGMDEDTAPLDFDSQVPEEQHGLRAPELMSLEEDDMDYLPSTTASSPAFRPEDSQLNADIVMENSESDSELPFFLSDPIEPDGHLFFRRHR